MPYSDEYVQYLEARLADSQQQQKTSHRAVQRLTNTTGNAPLPTRQQTAAAQRRAELEAKQQNLRAGVQPPTLPKVRSAPTRQPQSFGEDDYDDVWPPRQHTSSVRYDVGANGRPPVQEVFRQGNQTYLYRGDVPLDQPFFPNVPPRRSAKHYQLPPPPPQDAYADDEEEEAETHIPQAQRRRGKRKVTWHPLWWLGLGGIAMLLLWALLTSLGTWWQVQRDDWAYQRPRTFQLDAVVGHGDSQQTPSHFIALNLNRHVIIIEIPGGDTSKMRVYNGPTLFGDGEDLAPITLTFKDVNGDGKPDMLIHMRNPDGTAQILVMMNENGGFRPRKQGEEIHL